MRPLKLPAARRVDHAGAPRSAFTLGELLLVVAILGIVAMLLLPARRTAREAARSSQCKNNLKQIGLALHSYHDRYGSFPPAFTVDAEGRRLHSWRTLLLPYLDHPHVFDMIDFSKPWDHPVNAKARETRVSTYECPSLKDPSGRTPYLATPNGLIRPGGCRMADVTDGLMNCWAVIEVDAAHAAHWMAPVDADEPLALGMGSQFAGIHAGHFHVLRGDGSVESPEESLSAAERRARITISGND